ncbi:MAG: threonine/serine dehydratase [Anaerolineae bacterium]
MTLYYEVTLAEGRIRPYVRETPVELSLPLSEMGHGRVFLKLENIQHTGSFKLRGAVNKLLTLSPAQRAGGVVTASSGNHGAAVAYALNRLGARGVIVVPEIASPAKVAMIRRYGAEVIFHGDDSVVSEMYARQLALERGLPYISPYNDPDIVAGQGTIGLELARQVTPIDAVFVTVGGGGLISGIAGTLKAVYPGVQVIGCLPQNSPVMAESVRVGHIVEMESLPTLSDGSAGGIEPNAITFDLCRELVDDYVLVSESEIADAIRLIVDSHHTLIEGAAGVAVAGYMRRCEDFPGGNVVVVLCGANISREALRAIL